MRHIYLKTSLIIIITFLLGSSIAKAQWNLNNNLIAGKAQFSSAKWGDSILFFGGSTSGGLSSSVEIYNTNTESWETSTNMSVPKRFVTAVTGDSAIYVCGGQENPNALVGSNKVEIFKNGNWSVHTLPENIFLAEAVHVGNKIIIIGGLRAYTAQGPDFNPYIFIYDESTGVWETDTIAVPRQGMGTATNGNIAVFAGGLSGLNTVTDAMDIYNASTDTWTSSTLIFPRYRLAGAYADGKFLFAGGGESGPNPTNYVEVYDTNLNILDVDTLSTPRSGCFAAVTDSKILFTAGGVLNAATWSYVSPSNVTDIYDFVSDNWTQELLNEPRINHTAIGHKDKAYVAGGSDLSSGAPLDGLEIIEFAPVTSGFEKEINNQSRELIKIVDVLGRETRFKPNIPQIYIYSDGHAERKIVSQ